MTHRTIGICSLCGGPVRVPIVWAGVFAPRGRCSECNGIASHGAIIPMDPAPAKDPRAAEVDKLKGGS